MKKKRKQLKSHYVKTLQPKTDINNLLREVNKRIRKLSRTPYRNKYATEQLLNTIDDFGGVTVHRSSRGKKQATRISLNKNVTERQLKKIEKRLNKYLANKTSSLKGIQEMENKAKRTMLQTLKLTDEDVTEEDVDDYYSMLSDTNFNDLSEKMGASNVWAFIEDSKEMGADEEEFINMLENYNLVPDESLKASARRLYNKYVK